MYPYLRLAKVVAAARFGKTLSLEEVSRLTLLVWPGDIDVYPEMNNGRHLTIMDLGRVDFAIRTGVLQEAARRKWGLVAAGASARFRHRLRPFRRFELQTRALGRDDRWFYFLHETEQSGNVCSSALVRAGLRSDEGLVQTRKVMDAIGREDWDPVLPGWVVGWIEAEKERPDGTTR